jgi:heme-degrading monooxygenase HmoA
MFGRIARYNIALERLEDAVTSFTEAGQSLSELEGFTGGYLLVDEDEGSLLTLTLWRTRSALETSETRASLLRQRAARAAEGSVQSVHSYEIATEFAGEPNP